MKQLHFFLGFFLLICTTAWAQIKLGENLEQMSPFALLELESTELGLLVPRMTSAERDAAFDQAAPVGLVIFNTDVNGLQFFMEEIDPTSKRKTGHKVWETTTNQTEGGITLPDSSTAQMGDLFFNTDQQLLYYFGGSQWIPVSGNTQLIQNTTVFEGDQLTYTQTNGSTTTLDLAALSALTSSSLSGTGTDSQTLTVSGTLLTITNGNSINLAPLIDDRVAANGGGSATTGPQGPAGAAGASGHDGAGFQVGAGAPSSSVASPTFYVNNANGDQYYNSGGGSSWTLLPSSDNQTLTASALSANNTMTLAISEGNTVTLDFSAFSGGTGTDSQTLTASALSANNTMTLAISEGNTVTLDFSAFSGGTGTDSQTLALGNSASSTQTTLNIAGGNALSLQATGALTFSQSGTDTLLLNVPIAAVTNTDSQTLSTSALSANNTMTLAISEGNTVTLDLSSLNNSGTDSQTLALGNSASSTQTTLNIAGGNALSLQATGALTFSQSGTDTLLLNVPIAAVTNTDSQTLALGNSASSTQTTLNIAGGNALSLQATGSLSFTQTGTDTLLLTARDDRVAASVTHSTQRYDGTDWVANDSLLSDGSTQATLTTNFTVEGASTLKSTTTLEGPLVDASGNAGTPGQVLTATSTGTAWITTSSTGAVQLQSANYTANIDDGTILVESAAATTITLPVLSSADNGKKLTIKRADVYDGTGDTLAINAPDAIDDTTQGLNLNVSYQGYTLQAFAGQWHIVQRF